MTCTRGYMHIFRRSWQRTGPSWMRRRSLYVRQPDPPPFPCFATVPAVFCAQPVTVRHVSVAVHALPAMPELQCTARGMRASDMQKDAVLQGLPSQATAQPSRMRSRTRTLQQSPLPARGAPPHSAGLPRLPRQCRSALRQQQHCQRLRLRSVPWSRPWLNAPQEPVCTCMLASSHGRVAVTACHEADSRGRSKVPAVHAGDCRAPAEWLPVLPSHPRGPSMHA